MNKQLAISYGISEFPDNFFAKEERLYMDPLVVLYTGDTNGIEEFSPPKPVEMPKEPREINDIFRDKNVFYRKLQKKYRANQERIISDIICGIILRELRNGNDDDELTFFITSKFDTKKIVGRLAYLNLPMDRLTILFISRRLSDFYSRNMVSPFGPDFDLTELLLNKNSNAIFGPFPDDGTIGLLRTFFKTYDNVEFYPVRIDLFCQSLKRRDISKIREKIQSDYLSLDNTETLEVLGLLKGKGANKTRLPKILCECEQYIAKSDKFGS
jgi:hypothetical protein